MKRRTAGLLVMALLAVACTGGETALTSTTQALTASTTPSPPPTSTPTTAEQTSPPDVIYHNGNVVTVDDNFSIDEAVAITGSDITAVGGSKELLASAGAETTVIDLGGRTVIPGIVDPHTHAVQVHAPDGDGMRAGQQQLLSWGVTTAGMPTVTEDHLPAFQEMDAAGEMRIRAHLYLAYNWVCGETLGDFYLSQPFNRDPDARLAVAGVKIFGDGGVCNAMAFSVPYPDTVREDLKDRFNGLGSLYITRDEVASVVAEVDAAGGQTVIHAAGDRAMTEALHGIDMAGELVQPHQVHHNSAPALMDEDTLRLYGELGLTPVVFTMPWANGCDPGTGELWANLLPAAVYQIIEDRRPIQEANPGIKFSWHGDAPSLPGSPLEQMFTLVTAGYAEGGSLCYPPEWTDLPTVSAEEALMMVTINAAQAMGFEDRFGSIEVGKVADLTILQDDPLDDDHEMGLATNRALATIINGEVEFCVDICDLFGPVSEVDAMVNVSAGAVCAMFADGEGPVSWWPAEGSASDVIGDNHGELHDAAGFGSGVAGEAFQVSGGAISLTDQPPLDSGFTMEGWVNFDGPGFDDYQSIFNNNQAFLRKNDLTEGNGLAVFINLDDGTVEGRAQSTSIPEPGVWVHVAGTWDGSELKIYVNGALEGTSPRAGQMINETVLAQLGRGEQTETEGVNLRGRLDEFAIYDHALTDDQIEMVFSAGSTGKCQP